MINFRTFAYWTALIISILFVGSTMMFLLVTYVDIKAHAQSLTELIPILTLFVSAMGTFSAVYFGWRIDRRQSKEFELKIKELELKLESKSEKCITKNKLNEQTEK